MLQRMRDNSQGFIAWIIIGIVVASLTLWGISMYFHGEGSAQVDAAKVNDTLITQQELNADYQRIRRQMSEKAVNETQLRAFVLQQLITKAVLADAAEKNGFDFGDAQLNSMIAQMPAFQQDGKFSQARFASIMNQMMYTPEGFMRQMRSDMLVNQFHAGLAATSFILPDEVTTAYQLINQTRDFTLVTIPRSQFSSDVKVSGKAIKAYYDQHPDEFRTPEKMRIDYIEIDANTLKQAVKVSEPALKAFYEEHKSNYTKPVRWHVEHILIRDKDDKAGANAKLTELEKNLKAGQSFATLAKQYSDDPLSVKKGGDLGWITPGTLNPQLEAEIADLNVGGVSKPIETQYGFEIVKLVAKQAAKTQSFNEVKSDVEKAYVQQQVNKAFASKVDQLTNLSFETPDTLAPIAKQMNLTVQTSDWFGLQGEKKGILAMPAVLHAAFSDDVREGDNSNVLQPKPGIAIVIRQNSFQAAKAKPLTTVTSDIRKMLAKTMETAKANTLAETLKKQLEQGSTLSQLVSQYHLTSRIYNGIDYHNKKLDAQITQAAFAVPESTSNGKRIGLTELTSGDYVLLQLNKVNLAKKPSGKELADYKKQLKKEFSQTAFTELEQFYHKRAKIELFNQKK